MTAMTAVADHPLAQALAWALLHFVWQGALIALGAFVLFRWLGHSARARYLAGIAALAAMLMAPIVTTAWLGQASSQPGGVSAIAPTAPAAVTPAEAIAPVATATDSTVGSVSRSRIVTAGVLVLWVAGVVALSIRLLGGWIAARRLARRALSPASPEIRAMAERLAGQLGLHRIVDVAQSTAVVVPIMIGWLKPVVILPTAVLSGFSPEQVEALLVHELAHVRRHDYLVNLLQAMVETVLFYHPAVWWLSGRVRDEREHCCDDLSIQICDRLVYVRALSDLAAMSTPPLAMAASNGSLVARVRRILGRPPIESEARSGWLPVFLILALIAPILPVTLRSADRTIAPVTDEMIVDADTTSLPATQAVPVEPPAQQTTATTGQTSAAKPAAEPERIVPAETQADEIQQIQAALKKWSEAQRELDAKRFDLEVAQSDARTKAQMDELVVKLEQYRKEYDRASQMVDKGLASRDVLADLELKMRQTQQEIAGTKAQRDYDTLRLRLDQTEVQQQREYERLMREYAMLRGEMPSRNEGVEGGAALEAAADQSAPIREGDLLDVQVIGEPTLAPVRVDADGTIRLPFVAAIKVAGLTPAQAGEAIVKQLAERHLTASPRVSVKRVRPPK
ncbi:MAG: M56 family metallopeptidase [Vicinamibacterales bacterium]